MVNPLAQGQIRLAESRDLDLLQTMEEEIFGAGAMNLFALRPFVLTQRVYLYTDDQGRMSGYAILLPVRDRPFCEYLFSFGIKKEVQGHGLGLNFFRHLSKNCQDRYISELLLTVHPENHRAIKLYSSQAQEIHRELIPDCYGQGEDRLEILFRLVPETFCNLSA